MAWIFSLSAECGAQRESAERFTTHFKDFVLELSDGTKVPCSSWVYRGGDGMWWGSINPEGVIAGGKTNYALCKADRASEIGFKLYERLKGAPPFRFAIVGWEVDGFRKASEIETGNFENLNGIVLSREFCGSPDLRKKLEQFDGDHYWLPYRGETWEPYPDKA